MAEATSVVIIGKDPIILRLSARLGTEGFQALAARSTSEFENFLRLSKQCVAVVDGDLPQEELGQIDDLLHERRAVPTLTLVPSETHASFTAHGSRPSAGELASKSSRLQEVVFKPSSLEELALRTKALVLRAGYELPPIPSPDLPGRPEAAEGFRAGKIVAVFSAKGGVGKSTIAAHLAIGLSQFYHFRTLLVDSDLWFGDVGFLLDVHSKKSIFDLCSGAEPDLVSLKQAVVAHSSGISVLLRPSDLVSAEKLDIKAVGKMLAVASTVFDFVVIDTRSALDEMTLQILDVANQILLVTTPEISAVGNASRFLAIAEDLGYRPKVLLVVNRANTGIDVNSLERTLKMEVACTIVSAGLEVVQAANEGVSLFSKYPRGTQIVQNLAGVVEKVAGKPLPKPESRVHKSKNGTGHSLFGSLRERRT